MMAGGDPNVPGVRPRRPVVIEQMGTSETIPTPETSAALDEYVGDDEPMEFNPAIRILKTIFGPVGNFFAWIGRGFRSSEISVPEFTFRSQGGASITVLRHNDEILLRSQSPFDLANLFEIIESDGRQTHKPLGQIVDAMTTFPLQGFTIAGKFSVTPVYDSFAHSYTVRILPLNPSVSVERIFTAIGEFERQAERDIVEKVDAVPGSDPSIGDVLHTLTGIFDAELYRYASRLGVDKDSGDPRLRGMLNIESMISESASSNISLEGAVHVLEVGVRENSEWEVTAFILRFVKGDAPTEEGVDFNDVVTWVGKIDGSTNKITWYYHEVVSDPGHVTSPTSPFFLTTRNVLKKLIPPESWDSIKYGVELDTEGSGGSGSGGPAPGSPVTPATPAAGQAPQSTSAAGGQGASASASTAAPVWDVTEITAVPDEVIEAEYEGYSGDGESFTVYVDAETDEWSGDYDTSWTWGAQTAIGAEAFPVY